MAVCNRLWIGTGNGVIICVPLLENAAGQEPYNNCSSLFQSFLFKKHRVPDNLLVFVYYVVLCGVTVCCCCPVQQFDHMS